MSLYTGRGCRSRCTFCLWPQTVGGHRYRTRSVEHVVDEIALVRRYFPQARLAVANGNRTIVATPHQLGRYEKNSAEQILQLTAEAQQRVTQAGLSLTILPGGDVRIQEDLPELVERGQVLTLDGRVAATGNTELRQLLQRGGRDRGRDNDDNDSTHFLFP